MTPVSHNALGSAFLLLQQEQTDHPVWPKWTLTNPTDCTPENLVIRRGNVIESLDKDALLELHKARQKVIRDSQEDPIRHTWEPPIWRTIDLMMAKKRLQCPGAVLRLLVTGGIRSGKTEGSTRRVMANFCYTEDAKVWFTHETQTTSQAWQHPRVWRFVPRELRPEGGRAKKDLTTKFNFSEGSGFAGDKFNMKWECSDETGRKFTGGGMAEFRFYKSELSTFQGAELSCATSDELVPLKIVETIDERLNSRAGETSTPKFLHRIRRAIDLLEAGERLPLPLLGALYHGVHLISFTPKEGYSLTIADMMDGAVPLLELPADPELMPDRKVPRLKQPAKPERLIAYLHTYDNPFKGNWDGLRQMLKGKPESEIRITAYGDVTKNWSVEFVPPFTPAHHVITDRALIPRSGTLRLVIDPARARPWFMGFLLTDPLQRRFLLREWPQEGSIVPARPCRSIPNQGDPGAWAVPSRANKLNGDPGPAQGVKLGWGFDQYTREIWSVLMELGKWWFKPEQIESQTVTVTWERYPDWTITGAPMPLLETWIDPRFAASATAVAEGEKDYIESIEDAQSHYTLTGPGASSAESIRRALQPMPAPGKDIDTGDGLLIDALGSYDASTFDPLNISPQNCPAFRVWRECKGAIFTLHHFSIEPFKDTTRKNDEACKDPRDVMCMHELTNPVYINPDRTNQWKGGMTY